MTEIKTFNTFQDFLAHNQEVILENYYGHYHFLKELDKLNNKKIRLFESYNIVGERNKSIICIRVEGVYFIYGTDWTEEMIQKALERIDLARFQDYTFIGQSELVEKIFSQSKIVPKWRKKRIAYSCSSTSPLERNIEGIVENASINFLDQLIVLEIQYYREEFGEQGKRTDEELTEATLQGIMNQSLYLLRTNNTVHSILSVISYDRSKPMIGSLFTSPDSRNKGYAYRLLHEVTSGLINFGFKECGLLSNANNPASNKIFQKVGYKSKYQLILADT